MPWMRNQDRPTAQAAMDVLLVPMREGGCRSVRTAETAMSMPPSKTDRQRGSARCRSSFDCPPVADLARAEQARQCAARDEGRPPG